MKIERGNFVRRNRISEPDYLVRRHQTTSNGTIFDFWSDVLQFYDDSAHSKFPDLGGGFCHKMTQTGYITFADVPAYEETGAFTLEFVLRFDELPMADTLLMGNDLGGFFVAINRNGVSGLDLGKSGVADQHINYTWLADTAYHIVMVQRWSGGAPSEWELFINDVSQGTFADTNPYQTRAGVFGIAIPQWGAGAMPKNAYIDELAIYNAELSGADITSHFTAFDNGDGTYQGLVQATTGLQHYYRMENDWTDSKGTADGTFVEEANPNADVYFESALGNNKVDIHTNDLYMNDIYFSGDMFDLFSDAAFNFGGLVGFRFSNRKSYNDWLMQLVYSAAGADNGAVFTSKAIPGVTGGDFVFKANDVEALRLFGADQNGKFSGLLTIGDDSDGVSRLCIYSGDSQTNILKGFFNGDEQFRFENDGDLIMTTGDIHLPVDNNAVFFGAGDDASIYYNGTDLYIDSNLVGSGSLKVGDSTNNLQIKPDGSHQYNGTARIDWQKITASSITLTAGTSANAVADLQTHDDGNFYVLTEAAATPGQDLMVEFTSVVAFNWVNIIACYSGSSTHAVAVQLYDWVKGRYVTFDKMIDSVYDISTSGAYVEGNHDFFVPDDSSYIGTGGNAGKVRIRFYHPMAGNVAHTTAIDVVALYK